MAAGLFLLLLIACINLLPLDADASCYDGEYAVPKPPFGRCAGFRPCEPGNYCVEGKRRACTAGYFGNTSSLNSSSCSGLCPAGYFCPEGTVSFLSNPCGAPSQYCPPGSAEPQPASIGYYTVNEDGSDDPQHAQTRSAQRVCPYGHYCEAGQKFLCPGGTYGSEKGLSSPLCSGLCPWGFYCPPGSLRPKDLSCGDDARLYCPEGSTHPQAVGQGYFASDSQALVGGGYGSQTICTHGFFCVNGIRSLCPGGRHGGLPQEIRPLCSGPCLAGFFCPPGSILSTQFTCNRTDQYCPEGSAAPHQVSVGYFTFGLRNTSIFYLPDDLNAGRKVFPDDDLVLGELRIGQEICPPGSYCLSDGVSRLCPAGRYGSVSGLSIARCSGHCEAGYYCPEGSVSPRQLPCGNASVFCPIGSAEPQLVYLGHYSVDANGLDSEISAETRSAERRCEPGFYCQRGIRRQCPAGRYGETFGLDEPFCSGGCAPGYYCPTGSSSAFEVRCGDANRYCPANSSRPLWVSDGYYSIGNNVSTRYDQRPAPPGSYATQGLLYPCPAGRFGARSALTTAECSGECSVPGFYCPVGSLSPYQRVCGGDDRYCEAGTFAPVLVQRGFYTGDYQDESCPPGRWRNLTVPVSYYQDLPGGFSFLPTTNPLPPCELCPEGSYKLVTGDDISLCLPCNKRHAMSSSDRVTCQCLEVYLGNYIALFNLSTGLCDRIEEDAVAYLDWHQIHLNTSLTRSREFVCTPGHYCSEGLRYACPAGTFGDLPEETRPTCAGQCAAGYFCELGSASPFNERCGGADRICPTGSPLPILVPAGYFSNEDVAEDVRFSMAACPPGYYCPGDGRRYQCPAGTFASHTGSATAECEGLCERGYYCHSGSDSARQHRCGNASFYCVAGSASPTPATPGFYTITTGSNAGEQALWDPFNRTQSAELPCEPGYYCTAGIKYPCPPGSFGWRYGMTDSSCGGLVRLLALDVEMKLTFDSWLVSVPRDITVRLTSHLCLTLLQEQSGRASHTHGLMVSFPPLHHRSLYIC